MSASGSFFVRWRVRLGYPLAVAVLLFARPTLSSILLGALVGLIGLGLRAYAASYLRKQEVLTVTGPYAYTRNPLYLGSAILDLRFDSSGLLCDLLFCRHALRREGTPRASRRVFRSLRPRGSAFHSTRDGRKDLWRIRRLVLFCAVQKKP